MSLGFIIGRAGSGKTKLCIEEIQDQLSRADMGERDEFVLMTPEQATFANEKRILETLGNMGGFQVKVMSFRRLVHWVTQETGGGLEPSLDTVGKNLVLRGILERRRDELLAFRRVWDKQGFLVQLADMIDELRAYRIRPSQIEACMDRLAGDSSERFSSAEHGGPIDGKNREGSSDLEARLRDIHFVYTEYEKFLAQGWQDFSGELALLCTKLPEWERLPYTHFWFDGFHGFTPAEFEVIRVLLEAGRPVKVSLNLQAGDEKRELGEEEVFFPTWDTAKRLQQICIAGDYKQEDTVYANDPAFGRFRSSPELASLESVFAELIVHPMQDQDKASEKTTTKDFPVQITAYGDTKREIQCLAIEILEAVRDEKLRYQDLVVLIRHPETYERLINSIFPSYGIPYFFDCPKTLRFHPLIRLMHSIIAIVRDKWNTGTLLNYIKTGYSKLTDHQVFAFENYCLANGVIRMHWESRRPWRFMPTEESDQNGEGQDQEDFARTDQYMEYLRQEIWQPVEQLKRDLAAARTAQEMTEAVYQHLVQIRVEATCKRMASEARNRGETEKAQEYQRVWQALMKLLDQTVNFLGTLESRTASDEAEEGAARDDTYRLADAQGQELATFLAGVWESGLESIEIAALPPAFDQVTIGSMDRSRCPAATKVWIIGVNQGVIPSTFQEDNLLNEEHRRWLATQKLELAPDLQRRVYSESYLIYTALTRASCSLHVSYVRADEKGGSMTPSPLLNRITKIFPQITIQEDMPNKVRELVHPREALFLLGEALRQDRDDSRSLSHPWKPIPESQVDADDRNRLDPLEDTLGLWSYVYHWLSERKEYQRNLRQLQRAYDLTSIKQVLPKELSRKLYGDIIRTSVTRLEQFQACPFSHFLEYGLNLEPRAEYEIQAPDIGNFFHDSIEALMKELKSEGRSLHTMDPSELEDRVERVADIQLEKKENEIFQTSAWYRNLTGNLKRILCSSVLALAYQEKQSSFQAESFELAFGMGNKGGAEAISLDLGQDRTILLRGRVDRIDSVSHPETGEKMLRILDYKSGSMDVSLSEIYYGLKLQLILYMQAALASVQGSKPAGMFYFQVYDPVLSAGNVTEAQNDNWREVNRIKSRSLKGYLLKDQQIASLMDQDFSASLFLPVSTVKSGDFSQRSKLLSDQEFKLLGAYSLSLMQQTGKRLMEGDISLKPYNRGNRSACDYCLYRTVCRFDSSVPGHETRMIPRVRDEEVLSRLLQITTDTMTDPTTDTRIR